MQYKEFWQLIDDARTQSATSKTPQEEILTKQLSQYSRQSIYDFEYMLREYLAQLHHRTILTVYQSFDSPTSDDGYLYFRCWIIGQGKAFVETELSDNSKLSDNLPEFEALLYVADNAFKMGKYEGELPRDLGFRYLDYDGGGIPLKG